MRLTLILAVALVGCAKADTPSTDSAAATSAPATADAAPAAARLTAGDVAGEWNGVSYAEGSDSVLSRWSVRVGDSVSVVVQQGSRDSVRYRVVYDADSSVSTSEPYTATPGGPQVRVRAVGRLRDGKLVGQAVSTLAARPDSVVGRGRWEATRVP
jgi:hypothetical protein